MIAVMIDILRFELGPIQNQLPGHYRLCIRVVRALAHLVQRIDRRLFIIIDCCVIDAQSHGLLIEPVVGFYLG